MNYRHLEAILKHAGTYYTGKMEEDTIWCDGHVLFVSNDFAIAPGIEFPSSLPSMWAGWLSRPDAPCEPGPIYQFADKFWRQIGPVRIQEAYFLSLRGEGITWSPGGTTKDAVLIRREGKLIGAVMPGASFDASMQQATMRQAEPTETEVFRPFCSARNDYYLAGASVLRKELSDERGELARAEDRLEELEAEIEELEKSIRAKEARLAEMTKAEAA